MGRSRSAAALSRPAVPRHARRVSGPVRPAVVARPVPVPGQPRARTPVAQPHTTFGAAVRALPDHRVLDSLLRSRAWIWLLGIALGGIVFMQVSLLGMNAGIGRAVAQSTTLQHRNAQLQETVAELSDGGRVQTVAKRSGLISPSATDVSFLSARRGDAGRAASAMRPPSDEARQALATGGRPAASAVTQSTTAVVAPVTTADPVGAAAPVTATDTHAPAPAVPADTGVPPDTSTTLSADGGATATH